MITFPPSSRKGNHLSKMQAFLRIFQPGACTHCVGRFATCKTGGAYATNVPRVHWFNAAALTSLRREKTDVHAASFLITIYSGILPELCEAIIFNRKQYQ